MGCAADMIVIGKYDPKVADYLMYPKDYYNNCTKEDLVIGYICGVETSSQSEDLANAFGIELWDFTTHIKKNPDVNIKDVLDIIGMGEYGREPDRIREKIRLFNELKYLFIFQPNG